MKSKFAVVTPFPPSKITLNEYGYHLVKNLAEKDEIESIDVIADKCDSELEEDIGAHVNIHRVWKFNEWKTLFNIYRSVRKVKANVVIINLQFMLFSDQKVKAAIGLLLPWLLKVTGHRSIVLLHNIVEEVDLSDAGFTSNKILKFLYGLVGNILTRFILKADLVGVTIEKYVQVLKSKYKKDNVVLLPHGSFEIPPEPEITAEVEKPKVMAFGKFGTYKKVEILIEAVQMLRHKRNMEIEVVIAGTDNPNCPGYLEGVKKQYAHLEDITFTGYVPEEDVADLFINSSVVVFPYCSTTGSSGVLHQAGSYGKAVILPKLGDLQRLIEDEGYRGVYFYPDNTASLALGIESVLTQPKLRRELESENYLAASSLTLSDIADWYILHTEALMG